MHCTSCGIVLPENARFCPQCGAKQPVAGGVTPLEATVARRTGRADDIEETLWEGRGSLRVTYAILAVLGVLGVLALVIAIAYFGWFAGLMALLGDAVVALVVVSPRLYRHFATWYRLSTQRLIVEHGIITRSVDRVEVIDIQDVRYQQSALARLFGIGNVEVASGDRSTPQLLLYEIENVREVADKIDAARRAERNRRGLYIDTN